MGFLYKGKFLGKLRNRKEKKQSNEIQKEMASIQADFELEKKDIYGVPSSPTKRYTKEYTTKEWNRFSIDEQQILTNRYSVILTDYETKGERRSRIISKINLKNFDKVMKTFDEKQKIFWKSWDKGFDEAGFKNKNKNKIFGKSPPSNVDVIFGSKKKKVKII